MIRYGQTVNNIENQEIEMPKINGYKKQFSVELPQGAEEPIEEAPMEAPTEQPVEEAPVETPVEILTQVEKPAPITKGTITFGSGVKVGNMQEVLDKFAEAGISVRVTSGVRKPGQVGNAGNRSHHTKGNAIDIVPGKGETWESMRKKIKENEGLKNWLRSKKIGIIDETVAETMKKTGATGPHWHVGPDKWALRDFEAIFAKAGAKLPMMQSGGVFENFNFDNIYKNSTDKIKAVQRELGVKDDGLIGRQTISALQQRVGTTVDGKWGKNSIAAAKSYANQLVPQPQQFTAPASSTYVRRPIVPNMTIASAQETPVAEEPAEEPQNDVGLFMEMKNSISRVNQIAQHSPAAEFARSTVRRTVNNIGQKVFGEGTTLINGPIKTSENMPEDFNAEMESQWRWLAWQDPKIRRAGGIQRYFERNPNASVRLAMTNENLAKYNNYKQNSRYGTVTDEELGNLRFNPAATQYIIGRWVGTLTKDGMQINDNYDFGLTDRETTRYQEKAENTEGGQSSYARTRLWAQQHSMQEDDPEEWKTQYRLHYNI